MDRIDDFLTLVDYALNTKRKRHIVGGVLMSISMFFGGIAFTIITIKTEDERNERQP